MMTGVSGFLRDKESSFAQVVKYVFCGGASVVVDQVLFYALAWLAFPCLRPSDPAFRLLEFLGFEVSQVGEVDLARNYWIIKGICFLASNMVVYALNVKFVFKTGRHGKIAEIVLFFSSSLFQFFFIWLGGVLIRDLNWEVTYSNISMLLAAMVVNFIVRKKVVFKG